VPWKQLRRAVSFSRQAKHEEALIEVGSLLQREHNDARIYYQIALIQLEANQASQAWTTLELAHLLDSQSSVLALYRALVLAQLERWNEALEQAEELQRICPDNQFLDTLFCYIYLGSHRIPEALSRLKVDEPPGLIPWGRPELSPFSPLLSRLLLQIERRLLPLENPELRHAKVWDEPPTPPEVPVVWSLSALSKSIQGYLWQRRGIGFWEKALSCQDPDKRQQLLHSAVAAQRKAAELEPQQFRGHYYLGESLLYSSTGPDELLADRQRLEEAEQCFLRSWAQEGANPYLNFYLGRTMQLMGCPEAARDYLQHALDKFQKFPEAHYALGQVQLLMGQPDLAREWLKRSVSSDFLPVARDRLQELSQAWHNGLLEKLPPMPSWPPPVEATPSVDSDPTTPDPELAESPSDPNEETPESHQCAAPESPPENHETCPEIADSPTPECQPNLENPESQPPDRSD